MSLTSAPAVGRQVRSRSGVEGTVLAVGLFVMCSLLSLAKGASLVQYLYPLAALAAAASHLLRRKWHPYLCFTIVTWMLAPEMRRIADWQSTYHSQSLISLTPSLVSLLALPWAVRGRRRTYRDVAGLFAVTTVVMVFGFTIGLLRNGPSAAAVDILYLTAPMVTGLFVLMVVPSDAQVTSTIRAMAFWGSFGLGAYGILQFLVLPPWDARWIIDSAVSNLGDAQPGQFRVFSTLSTTGPFGQVIAALLLLLVAEPRFRRQVLGAGFGLAALGATLVRAGWIGLALGMATLGLMGRGRVARLAGVGLLLILGLLLIGGPVTDRVASRAERTASSSTDDISLAARVQFQSEIAPEVLSDPVGLGMGSTGRAVELGGSALADPKFHNFDSGVFENLTRYGALGGLAVLVSLAMAVGGIVRRARSGTLLDAASAAALVALATGMVFTDTMRGSYGLVLWIIVGAQGRVPRMSRAPTP